MTIQCRRILDDVALAVFEIATLEYDDVRGDGRIWSLGHKIDAHRLRAAGIDENDAPSPGPTWITLPSGSTSRHVPLKTKKHA